jgi:hypothetical protein
MVQLFLGPARGQMADLLPIVRQAENHKLLLMVFVVLPQRCILRENHFQMEAIRVIVCLAVFILKWVIVIHIGVQ